MTANDGLRLFGRYAAPPNALHYCGPDDEIGLALQQRAGPDDLRGLASQFEGAWPYLELIADSLGLEDPFDRVAVEAYWEGSPLLGDVASDVLDSMTAQVHGPRSAYAEPISLAARRAVPHHSYHVYCVYPWAGLLRRGIKDPSVRIIDQCRISVGRIVSTTPLTVRRRPLVAAAGRLFEAEPRIEPLLPCPDETIVPAIGDRVSVHWGWLCSVLDGQTAERIAALDARHRTIANDITVVASRELSTHSTTA